MNSLDHRGRSQAPPLRVLMVGAGAVGQVYAHHLKKGGAHVTLLVRPKYAADCRAGLTLYRIAGRRRIPCTFQPDAVITDIATASERRYDQVWLCISTAALERAMKDELTQLLASLHGCTLVVLQPGAHVPELLAEHVPERQIVDGGIAMVAYQAPLVSGEVSADGVAFLLATSPFTGNDAPGVVASLKAGGCPARVDPNTRALMAYGTATLNPLMAALQGAGWKMAGLREGEWAKLGTSACSQARRLTESMIEAPPPAMLGLLRAPTLRFASRIAPKLAPFELEVYLQYHFTKVSDQTRLLLGQFVQDGETRGIDVSALRELRARVFADRP